MSLQLPQCSTEGHDDVITVAMTFRWKVSIHSEKGTLHTITQSEQDEGGKLSLHKH